MQNIKYAVKYSLSFTLKSVSKAEVTHMISEVSDDSRSAGGVQEQYSSPQSLIGKDYLDHKVALLHNKL